MLNNPQKDSLLRVFFSCQESNSFCPLCGTDLTDYLSQIREIDRQNQLIHTDPELVIQNRGYIRLGIARLIFGVLAAISFSLFYGCLEWGWTDGIGIFGMSMFIFTIIPFIALCIARGIRKNKIKKTLKERMTT